MPAPETRLIAPGGIPLASSSTMQFDQARNLFSRSTFSFILLLILQIVTATSAVAEPDGQERIIRLATTTSTDNSGLLRSLLPPFEKRALPR